MNSWFDISSTDTDRDPLSQKVFGLAIEVHRALGPGLFEAAYAECLAHDLSQAGLRFAREVPLSLQYKAVKLSCVYQMDFLVEDTLVLELKSVDRFDPVHKAQLLTYLRLSGKSVGLLLNFNQARLRDGILRMALTQQKLSALSASSALSA
jgi:GxxExxY protein